MHLVRVLGKLEPGGAQLAVLRLSHELERRHGVRTSLLVGDATPEGLDLARRHGVHTLAFRTRPVVHPVRNLQWQLSRPFALWLADHLGGADVVHAHMVGAWWATAQVIGGAIPFAASEHNEVNWSARHIRSLRPAAARVDRFFAMGPAARAFALAAGVPATAIVGARSPVAGLQATASANLPGPRLTFAGRFLADKGADVLVEAFALLPEGLVTAYLLGDGPMRPQLVAAIRHRGLAGRVVLPGWVERPWSFVAGSDVHVVPSREEAWSQSAVLALGLGVPVVGTAVDGLIDTLSDGRGITVPPDDPSALAGAVRDVLTGRRRVDAAKGVAYAARFTPARVADFHLAVYEQLVRDRRSSAVGAGEADNGSVTARSG